MKNNQEISAFLSELFKNAELRNDYLGIISVSDIDQSDPFNSIIDMIDGENGFDVEILYYGSAMEFLSKNDNSLADSLSLASERGFELGSLGSEVLASLLATDMERDNFNDLKSEIEDFFGEEE